MVKYQSRIGFRQNLNCGFKTGIVETNSLSVGAERTKIKGAAKSYKLQVEINMVQSTIQQYITTME